MDNLIIDHNNGHVSEYRLISDGNDLPIAYQLPMSDSLIELLERMRHNKTRLRFHWGDIETGQDWGEFYDIEGRIGLSRGFKARFPILVHNSRSMGGGLLSNSIVKIVTSEGKKLVYIHPNYKEPEL